MALTQAQIQANEDFKNKKIDRATYDKIYLAPKTTTQPTVSQPKPTVTPVIKPIVTKPQTQPDQILYNPTNGKPITVTGNYVNDYLNKGYTTSTPTKLPTANLLDPSNVTPEYANIADLASKNMYVPEQQPQQQMVQQLKSMSQPKITDNTSQINNMYKENTNALVQAVKQRIAESKAGQQQIIQQAPQQFDPLRGQSEVDRETQLRTALERSANLGDRGGIGRQEALLTQTEGANRLNSINQQQQNVVDSANFEIARLENEGRFQEAQIVSEQAAKQIQDLLNEQSRQQSLSIQQEQTAYNRSQDALNNQFTQQKYQDSLNQNQLAQEQQAFGTQINANYFDLANFRDSLIRQGAPQWQIDQVEAARVQKIVENKLDPNTGRPLPVDNTAKIWDNAMEKWKAGIPLTQQEMQAIGTRTPTKPISSGSGGTSNADFDNAMNKWKALGYADDDIAKKLNVPNGAVYGGTDAEPLTPAEEFRKFEATIYDTANSSPTVALDTLKVNKDNIILLKGIDYYDSMISRIMDAMSTASQGRTGWQQTK